MNARGALCAMGTVLVIVGAACGITADSEPRALPVTTTTSTTPTSEPTGDQLSNVYMVTNGALVPTRRRVPARNPTEIMNSVLIRPDESEGETLSSSVPANTKLLSARRGQNGILEVDLSADFEDVQGDARVLAIGQIVMSTTELPGVETLQFFIEGKPLKVFSGERGEVNTVTACDYAERLSNPTDDDSELTPGQSVALAERRNALRQDC
ncbi:MAG: GerMN domain-containing protein [Microthrixaceae bacterium]